MTDKRKMRNERKKAYFESVKAGRMTPAFYEVVSYAATRELRCKRYCMISADRKKDIVQDICIKIACDLNLIGRKHDPSSGDIPIIKTVQSMTRTHAKNLRRSEERRKARERAIGIDQDPSSGIKDAACWISAVDLIEASIKQARIDINADARELADKLLWDLTERLGA